MLQINLKTSIYIYETLNRLQTEKNIEKSSSRHIIVKILKEKKKILKAARYKRTTIRLTAYFSS